MDPAGLESARFANLVHYYLIEHFIGGWTEEARAEQRRLNDYLSAELTLEPIELPKHGIKPPSFWRGSPDGGIDIAQVEALAAAMGAGKRR